VRSARYLFEATLGENVCGSTRHTFNLQFSWACLGLGTYGFHSVVPGLLVPIRDLKLKSSGLNESRLSLTLRLIVRFFTSLAWWWRVCVFRQIPFEAALPEFTEVVSPDTLGRDIRVLLRKYLYISRSCHAEIPSEPYGNLILVRKFFTQLAYGIVSCVSPNIEISPEESA
jgi:hypothetical protein